VTLASYTGGIVIASVRPSSSSAAASSRTNATQFGCVAAHVAEPSAKANCS
jgi:hypothetical protein